MSKFFVLCAFCYCVCAWSALAICGENEKTDGFNIQIDDSALYVSDGDVPVMTYNYAFLEHLNVPKKDPRRNAGDYVHPLYGVNGEVLTDDAPKDHYHHHGLFWTWPGVEVWQEDGTSKRYDLWTSNTKIRQRFVRFVSTSCEKDKAVFVVENGWYTDGCSTMLDIEIDPAKKGLAIAENGPFYGEKIIREIASFTIYPIESQEGVKSRAIDVCLTLIPTSKPVSLQGAEKKSYGGLTLRFRPQGKERVDRFITTDEGVALEDMPEKPLRWADYSSRFGAIDQLTGKTDALSGAAIFLASDFPDYPPTWLTRYYGPLCVGFPGVVAKRFEPGEEIVMKVRIWIHEGCAPKETLTKVYESWLNSTATESNVQ